MSHNISKNKKISKYDLEDNIINSITEDTPITLDNLDPHLRTQIQTWGAPAGSSYDDSNLRSRIIKLESDMSTNNTHDAAVDASISNINSQVNTNKNDIENIKDTKADKSEIRKNTDPIQINDLSADLQDKINYSYGYYQTVVPDGSATIAATDLASLNTAINNLDTNKADKTELAKYRLLANSITVNDMDTNCASAINSVSTINTALINKADKSELANYRNVSNLISDNDLESSLLNKIDTSYSLVKNVDTAVETMVEAKTEDIQDTISNRLIGNYQQFLAIDPSASDSSLISGMPYRRQIVVRAGNTDPDGEDYDTYDVYDTLTWVVRDIVGIPYDDALISVANQQAVSDWVSSLPNSQKNDDPIRSGNSIGGASHGISIDSNFTVFEIAAYVLDRYDALKADYDALKTDYNALKTDYDALKTDYNTLYNSFNDHQNKALAGGIHYDIESRLLDLENKIDSIISLPGGS